MEVCALGESFYHSKVDHKEFFFSAFTQQSLSIYVYHGTLHSVNRNITPHASYFKFVFIFDDISFCFLLDIISLVRKLSGSLLRKTYSRLYYGRPLLFCFRVLFFFLCFCLRFRQKLLPVVDRKSKINGSKVGDKLRVISWFYLVYKLWGNYFFELAIPRNVHPFIKTKISLSSFDNDICMFSAQFNAAAKWCFIRF